jgi:hypothetical protein
MIPAGEGMVEVKRVLEIDISSQPSVVDNFY